MTFLRFLVDNRLFLLAGLLLTFSSSYGQTYFISIFAGEIRAEFGLSHGAWGGIYTLGTTASAVAMLWAGTLTDRFRVRHIATVVMLLSALACIAMATATGPVMLIFVIFALRLTGQGMLSQLSSVAMARWFVATRGRALSISAMGFALGQALLPVVFVALLASMDWRSLWVVAAGMLVLALPVVVTLLRAERSPRSMAEEKSALGLGGKHWSRRQMLGHPLFWFVMPTLLGPSAWGTALFFQQVHLTEVKGWELVDYVALLPVYTAVSVATTFASGWAIDRFGTGRLMRVFLAPFAASFLVISLSPTLGGAALGLILFGVGQGVQPTLNGAFWAEHYGTRHMGGIKSIAASVMVFGSAIGPGISGILIDWGFAFPEQMLFYAGYFAVSGILASVGLALYARPSPALAQIDV